MAIKFRLPLVRRSRTVALSALSKGFLVLLVLVAPLRSQQAEAQMTPVEDLRYLEARVHYEGYVTDIMRLPPGFFLKFEETITAYLEGAKAGSVEASAFQSSEFFPAGIYMSGTASGSWNVNPAEYYTATAHTHLKVRLDHCIDFSFYGQVDPGDTGAYVMILGEGLTYVRVAAGESTLAGRLGPGEYVFEGKSSIGTTVENQYGGTYSMIWTCSQCSSFIGVQPADLDVPCNTDAIFCVTPATGGLTYQWRRNLVPLVNSAHFSGATTACLTIHDACDPDTGYYDVVVSDGSVNEPSRLAHLGITGTTGVGTGPSTALSLLRLDAAAPNPFRTSTSCRFNAPRPFVARVTIHDATGRMVYQFSDQVLSGPGTLSWDGRTVSGSLAPAGLYFLRVMSEAGAQVRRLALLR
jgi:hypothetical protein